MFSHVMLGTNDMERSKHFYDAVFAALGARPGWIDDKGRLVYVHHGAAFMVSTPLDGRPACAANGGTIGLTCDRPDQVEAVHQAGVSAGGKSIEDPPGPRESSFGRLFVAYLRDPDGNKLCVLHRQSDQ